MNEWQTTEVAYSTQILPFSKDQFSVGSESDYQTVNPKV